MGIDRACRQKQRRERIATAVLAGLVSNADEVGAGVDKAKSYPAGVDVILSRSSVRLDDALIAELDQEDGDE